MSVLSILEMGARSLAAPSTERLLASLLIKVKPSPQLTLHGTRSAVLRCVRWPGPVGLLGGRCDCLPPHILWGWLSDWLVVWGREAGRLARYRCMGFIEGLLTRRHSFISQESIWELLAVCRACSACSVCVFAGLPLHHPPWRPLPHQTLQYSSPVCWSNQRSLWRQETIIEKKSIFSKR